MGLRVVAHGGLRVDETILSALVKHPLPLSALSEALRATMRSLQEDCESCTSRVRASTAELLATECHLLGVQDRPHPAGGPPTVIGGPGASDPLRQVAANTGAEARSEELGRLGYRVPSGYEVSADHSCTLRCEYAFGSP